MKRSLVLALLILVPAFGACTSMRDSIKSRNVGIREDVFNELTEKTPIPEGYADIRILVSLKMHQPGYYLLDNKTHGTPDYTLLINIDGQAVRFKAALKEEGIEPGTPSTPEAGEGIRYLFERNLRLKAGVHKLFVALPEDGVAVEKEIALQDGSDNNLELEPVYHSAKKKGIRDSVYIEGDPSFYKGVRGLVVIFNDQTL